MVVGRLDSNLHVELKASEGLVTIDWRARSHAVSLIIYVLAAE